MENKKGKAAAKIYWRKAGKHARDLFKLPPSERAAKVAEDRTKFDGMIADLKAKAAELPALRAQHERLQDKIHRFHLDVAILAAQISPAAFAGGPDDMRAAIKLALKRLRDTKVIIGGIVQENTEKEKKALAEAGKADLAKVRKGYQCAAKLVTGELKDSSRAFPKWRRYVAAKKVTPGSNLEKVLESYRQRWQNHGWTLLELAKEKREFESWWKQEKSDQAKKAAQKKNAGKSKQANKRGRGRVKRLKSDLRLMEVRRHKQGYCRECGRRVRANERLCDKCVSGKPLLFTRKKCDLAESI
jgi:RNA polymerase-binding transcription factor DksA